MSDLSPMRGCALSPNRMEERPGICIWCGAPLPKYHRRWCSEECENVYSRNHDWTMARVEALRRSSGIVGDLRIAYSEARCDQCAVPSGPGITFEVNHVQPRRGRGYGKGCHNHQTNLQVLCHGCHVAETKRQNAEAAILPALEHGILTPEEAHEAIEAALHYKNARIRRAEERDARRAARLAAARHPDDSLWDGVA